MSEPTNDPNARNRWAIIYEATTGATAPDHHEEKPGTSQKSVTAGHEPDHFDARGIIMVPILVIATCIGAYILITVLFNQIDVGVPLTADASPDAKAFASKSYNERITKISSSDDKSLVNAPRLEYVKQIDNNRNGNKDPQFVRSFLPVQGGKNTYEVTPQDIYPQNYADPRTGEKSLVEYKWLNKEKTAAQIPVNEAMHLLAGKLPAKKVGANSSTAANAKLSNGGHAVTAVPATPTDEKPADHKHDDKKPADEKKH